MTQRKPKRLARRVTRADLEAARLGTPCLFKVANEHGVEGFLPVGCLGLLAGAPGSGKSALALELLLAAANGCPLLDEDAQGIPYATAEQAGNVLYVSFEETFGQLAHRLDKICESRGRDDSYLERMHVLGCDETNGSPLLEYDAHSGRAVETELHENIAYQLQEDGPWSLIVLDTLAQSLPGAVETDQKAATACLQHLRRWTELPGRPAVLVVHHSRKSEWVNANLTEWLDRALSQDSVRGASAIVATARWVGMVARPPRTRDVYFEVTKAGGVADDAMPRLRLHLNRSGVLAPLRAPGRQQRGLFTDPKNTD